MKIEDFNRAKAEAESLAERFLFQVIGLPSPFTAVVTLVFVGCVVFTAWTLLR